MRKSTCRSAMSRRTSSPARGTIMLDWLADNLSIIMFVSMFFFIFMGYPVAFFNPIGISDIVLRMWAGVAADPVLASIPMFIFMGAILERSGSAKDMLDASAGRL